MRRSRRSLTVRTTVPPSEDSETAQCRAQRAVDRINGMHDDVLFVAIKKAKKLIDWPDDAEVLSYYSLRGLDRDADAVVCVGGPHPAEDDLRADARVLSADNPRIRSGGTELSTRRESEPPVYRKLNYTDADGQGRAVASKTYTGLTGELFDARHADEIEQAAHRNRPILATEDDHRHVYLLTNVATELPIDRLMGYDTFLDPVRHQIDVRDSALDLLDTMADVAQDSEDDAEYAADGGTITVGGRSRNGTRSLRKPARASRSGPSATLSATSTTPGSSRKESTCKTAGDFRLSLNSVQG